MQSEKLVMEFIPVKGKSNKISVYLGVNTTSC